MGRPKRVWYEGACYHVMGRGNRHCTIYRDEEDYHLFMKLLSSVRERYPFRLHACCLMTNHFHLQLTTKTDPVWKIMKPLMNQYAKIFNRKYGYDGHLFDSRYSSGLIEDDRYFLEVSRYIHLNPVKAQMVKDPFDYEYSSYREFMGDDETTGKQYADHRDATKAGTLISELTDTTAVLSYFGVYDNPHEQYRKFVEDKISHEEQEMRIQKDVKENELWLPE